MNANNGRPVPADEVPTQHNLGQKQKNTILKPVGAQVVRLPSGETLVELEISPFEAVTLMMPEEGRQQFVAALTGGIIPASGLELPPGA